jgi:hypothetical protein
MVISMVATGPVTHSGHCSVGRVLFVELVRSHPIRDADGVSWRKLPTTIARRVRGFRPEVSMHILSLVSAV